MLRCLGCRSTWAERRCCQLQPIHVGIQAAMACSEAKYDNLLLPGKVTVGILAGCAAKRCFDEGSLFLEVSCFHLLGLGCSLPIVDVTLPWLWGLCVSLISRASLVENYLCQVQPCQKDLGGEARQKAS